MRDAAPESPVRTGRNEEDPTEPGSSAPAADGAPSAPASTARRLLTLTLKIVVSAALLWLLFTRVDTARLWASLRAASPLWLTIALALFGLNILVSAWRWGLLLHAQRVGASLGTLFSSYLVATFFNNFLPSNIGGDVVRIRDTARLARSTTLATTVILIDRGVGLLALVLVAAIGATGASWLPGGIGAPVKAPLLWLVFVAGFVACVHAVRQPTNVHWVLSPLRAFHAEWVEQRLQRIVDVLHRFRAEPLALVGGAAGALAVQTILVLFYAAIARSLAVPISVWHLAIIVPVSFIVQMVPVSVNGFGVREATFVFYFTRLRLPIESAILVSFAGALLMMVFSLSGAAVYVTRRPVA